MTVAGTWQNEYGSIMTLNVSGNEISGIYESSTGSTGQYEVVGYQLSADPTTEAGQPVALAIEWHSVVEGLSDASWNWSSGMNGQISIQEGVEVLALEHLMIASGEFVGLCGPGNYADKLSYKRVSAKAAEKPSRRPGTPSADNPLSGTWIAGNLTLELVVTPAEENRFGHVSGTITNGDLTSPINGMTDINATADGLTLQSVALNGIFDQENNGSVWSLAGSLNLGTGQLELLRMQSVSTAPENSWTQTRMFFTAFTRA